MEKFEIRCPDWIDDAVDEIESYDHGDAAEDWVKFFEYDHRSFYVANELEAVVVYVKTKNEKKWKKFSVIGKMNPIYFAEELDEEE